MCITIAHMYNIYIYIHIYMSEKIVLPLCPDGPQEGVRLLLGNTRLRQRTFPHWETCRGSEVVGRRVVGTCDRN